MTQSKKDSSIEVKQSLLKAKTPDAVIDVIKSYSRNDEIDNHADFDNESILWRINNSFSNDNENASLVKLVRLALKVMESRQAEGMIKNYRASGITAERVKAEKDLTDHLKSIHEKNSFKPFEQIMGMLKNALVDFCLSVSKFSSTCHTLLAYQKDNRDTHGSRR